MSRFTISNLRANVDDINALLAKSGSLFFYEVNSRNGYYAVDLCHKVRGTIRNIDCHEPARVLSERVDDDYEYYMGKEAA
tara:strand:+ start:2972 stop:3211 length:240 start_codon:yes stop_codon:yes gene_type:complete